MENLNELKQKFFDAIETICKDYEVEHLSKSDKKKLPKMFAEYEMFLNDFREFNSGNEWQISEFLKDYEL